MKHQIKRGLSLLLTLAMLCSLLILPAAAAETWDGTAITAVTEADGTYKLSTGAQLAWLAQQVNGGADFAGKTVLLTADIDLGGKAWTPIGSAQPYSDTGEGVQSGNYTGKAFAGIFDGDGHTISGLYINNKDGYVGLFGYMTGTVKDLTVSGEVTGADCTAGIAAVGCGTFSGVTNQVKVNSEGNCVGGIIGDACGNFTITDCHNQAVLTNGGASAEKSTGRMGGIIGRVETLHSGRVTNCSNTAALTGYQYIGGIIGGCFGGVTVQACYNTGKLTGISFGKVYMGGIVGKLQSGTVDSCYNWGDISVNGWADGHTRYAAGIAGSEEDHAVGTAVTNCYSIGTITIDVSKKTYGSKFIYACGGVAGGNQATGENTMSYENCFYLEGCIPSQDEHHADYKFWCDVWKNNKKAYDTENIRSKTMDELKDSEVLSALGDYFVAVSGSYPTLYWQDGTSVTPPVRSFEVTSAVSGGAATVTVTGSADEGSTVSFTVGNIESGKQIKSVRVIASSGAEVASTCNNGTYSFTMPSRAVCVTVVLENTVADGAASHTVKLPADLDAIWTVTADSTYYDKSNGTAKAGASMTVIVAKEDKALTSSFAGISVTTAGGTAVSVTERDVKTMSGARYYGEYSFTMPDGAVTVTLNAEYSDLSVYVKENGVSTLTETITRAQMETLANKNGKGYYSGWSSETEPFIGVAEQYITLEQVLEYSDIELATGDSVSVATPDGFEQTYTYAQLTAQRKYYSDILENGKSAASGTDFGYAFILKGNMAFTADEISTVVCDTLNTYRFVYGQTTEELTGAVKCVDSMPRSVVSLTVNRAATRSDVSWYDKDKTEFTLTTAAQLCGLAELVNGTAYDDNGALMKDNFSGKTVKLGGNIALAEDGLYTATKNVKYGTADYAMVTTQYCLTADAPIWTPIGSGTAASNTGATTANAFAGTFDGCGYTISGVYTGTKDAAAGNTATVQGLFGVVSGTVKNVTVTGCITAKAVAGGIVAHLAGGTIENCTNKAAVFADGGTTPNGSIENGTSQLGTVGGIVGNVMTGSSVTGCTNYGDVTCANSNKGGRVGGIIGLIDNEGYVVTISGNVNHGTIDAYQYTGGIVGANFSKNAPIDRCANTGKVIGHSSGQTHVGGIVSHTFSSVTNCYNTGDYGISIDGSGGNKVSHMAGIAADLKAGSITNCYNTGKNFWTSVAAGTATSRSSYGGICGTGYGNSGDNKLTNCYTAVDDGEDLKELSSAELTLVTTADGLAAKLGSAFTTDAANINGGWPVLSGQVTGGDPLAKVWDGETLDIRWFTKDTTAKSFYITYPAEFAGLAALINGIYNEDIKYIYGDESYIVDKVSSGGDSGENNESTDAYHYGAYDFNGKTIYLCADIDMGEDNSYMPLGGQYLMTNEDTSTKIGSSFCGMLDGRGHNVTIYCDRHCSGNYGDGQAIGLIGRIGVHDSDPEESRPANAGVKNLAVYGSVSGNRSVGGIIGKIGRSSGGVTIENCANFALVSGTDAKGTGGIVGAAWNGGTIKNCYNAGKVTSTFTNAVAGIAGSCEIKLINCFNVGPVVDSRTDTAAIASNNGGSRFTNCYWLTGTADVGVYNSTTTEVTQKTAAEMKTDAFVLTLGSAFRVDSGSINNGYPVLAWQGGREPVENIGITVANGAGAAGTTADGVTTLAAGSASGALTITVTAPEYGWVEGSNTFTVTCDKACAVLVKDSDGNYTALTAAGDDHAYTATLGADDTIVVIVRGDLDMDGVIGSADTTLARRFAAALDTPSALQKLSLGVTRFTGMTALRVQRAATGTYRFGW